jgi:hypothetical protein
MAVDHRRVISDFHRNRQFSLVLGCLQASFHPFSPHIASAECKKGNALPPQRPLLGLVTASVLLGQVGPAEVSPPEVGLDEVWRDVPVFIPPLIPRREALLQELEMLRVRHRSRLPL